MGMPVEVPTRFGGRERLSPDEIEGAELRSIPRSSRLAEPLDVKPARAAKALTTLGIETRGDLLEHLPFRLEDRREVRSVATLGAGEDATVVVEVRKIAARRAYRRRRLVIVEATVADESGPMKATFFNQPWLKDRYPPGTLLVLHGRYTGSNRFNVSEHEQAKGASADDLHSTGLVPVYPASEGIPAPRMRELVFEQRGLEREVIEPLPSRMRAREQLPDRAAALAAVHFPDAEEDQDGGRRRLAFDEFLALQLTLLGRREERRVAGAEPLEGPRELTARWLADALPFEPTGDQRAAIDTLDEDLAGAHPAQRLLMGEVGSGKTMVALHGMLRAVEHGAQAALMAPTETLAEQHFATLQSLSGGELVPMALLTGSTAAARRNDILAKLASGELPIVVGTHALVEDDVVFDRLAVTVVDEQHRFGVRQRVALDRKGRDGRAPHTLHLTATPIPRTLSLTAYGDLDVTTLRELPAGRKPITTHLASTERERERAYERIREEVRAGRQAFVVCPLVEESEALQAKAATEEFERLRTTEFTDLRVALLHGQLRPRAKQEAMAAFAAGEADVLVATSVIEVGIDVPNATVMLVEDAERYGISQLHQLRGRVGRGGHASVCLLFGSKDSPRLRALADNDDGFELAEIDLSLRGEGELLGTRQSGLAELRAARLPEDADVLARARAVAADLLADDPALEARENALLRLELERRFGELAHEPIPA